MASRVDMEFMRECIARLTKVGVALSAEKNLNRLFEMIIDEARILTNADGGTLYLVSETDNVLHFVVVQNESLGIRMGGVAGPISWEPIPLILPNGSNNYSNVSAYAALTGEVLNISDVYYAEGFNFEGTRDFDSRTGYRSKSMLVVPMRDHEGVITGVLQLINAMDRETGEVTTFSRESEMLAESLASQAAVALSQKRLIRELETLLDAFIKTIGTAIDEKSPYTSGHIRRVAELSVALAKQVNERKKDFGLPSFLSETELEELRMAAWLHDVGKITTPEHVLDKRSKLETVFDRIELIRLRFEVMLREFELSLTRRFLRSGSGGEYLQQVKSEVEKYLNEIKENLAFLEKVNRGDCRLEDIHLERLSKMGLNYSFFSFLRGREEKVISEREEEKLATRQGTLSEGERKIVNNHALMTYKMLSSLPFPRKLRGIPLYASAHHERLDGKGYPLGLKGKEIPLQARIIAIADIFEALTASDRPYKKGKTVKEALRIMEDMAASGHIDGDLLKIFIEGNIPLEYAKRELSPDQVDI
ncbi:MAG: HD domain-containing protein [Syntrophales bacterium]|nr:HD domain-containing protein [Syntrophales bacterium]